MLSGAIATRLLGLNGVFAFALALIVLMSAGGVYLNANPGNARIDAKSQLPESEVDFDSRNEIELQLQDLMVAEAIEVIKVNLMSAYGLDRRRATGFSRWVYEAHVATGVPVVHLVSLIATESSFRVSVKSAAGAVGPAQVIPRFWSDYCSGDLADPQSNILCGARILKLYRERCDAWDCAFKTYNVGPSNYERSDYLPAMARYIKKIYRYQALFAGLRDSFPGTDTSLRLQVAER